MRTDTVNATITIQDIENAETLYIELTKEQAELERIEGTFETYGSRLIIRPRFSNKANLNVVFKEAA